MRHKFERRIKSGLGGKQPEAVLPSNIVLANNPLPTPKIIKKAGSEATLISEKEKTEDSIIFNTNTENNAVKEEEIYNIENKVGYITHETEGKSDLYQRDVCISTGDMEIPDKIIPNTYNKVKIAYEDKKAIDEKEKKIEEEKIKQQTLRQEKILKLREIQMGKTKFKIRPRDILIIIIIVGIIVTGITIFAIYFLKETGKNSRK